jgi:flagellar biosynthesis protein FlhB
MGDNGQRTEQPTQRRIEKARREGNFASSREFSASLQFLLFVFLLSCWGGAWLAALKESSIVMLRRAFEPDLTPAEIIRTTLDAGWRILPIPAEAGGLLVAAAVAAQLATTRFGLSYSKLSPDLKRLNPLSKLRQIPRQNVPALVQAMVLLPFLAVVMYGLLADHWTEFLMLPAQSITSAWSLVAERIEGLLWKAAGVLFVLGCFDLFRQHKRYTKDLRMSKQEIRDESKEAEGNPQMKAKIRRIQRDKLRRQMMSAVPTASAVIVNPTHFAVAIRYDIECMPAPVVVAKGKNYLALRIRQRAIENQVPIIENPPLAQALYGSVDVGQEIPAKLYRAVAEILAYVYRLTRRS